jgi:PEP-CTERM motif
MRNMRKMMLRAGLAAMALGMAGSAQAVVTYTFKADSAFPDLSYGSFQFSTANFLTGDNVIPLASLTSCSVTYSPTGQSCGDQRLETLFYISPPFYETVKFGLLDGSATYYYFDQGSFATLGTHSSQIFGASQFATLNVSNGGVPEPASWALMIAGFGLVGGAMRRRVTKVSYA